MIEEALNSAELKWESIELKRGEFLIRAGEKERHLGFVTKGAMRAFTYKAEEEYTIRFAYTNSIVAAIPSYFSDEPSDLNIQAIRKTSLLRTSKIEFERFASQSKERLQNYNFLLKELIASFYEREIDLLTPSPAERIARIRKRSPQVFQEIPNRYIASYLRMSPETLSRLLKS